MSLQTGVQYSNKGYRTITIYNFLSFVRPPPISIKSTISDFYVDVPLQATYLFGNTKVQMLAGFGVTTNFFLKETQTTVSVYADGSSIKETEEDIPGTFKKINISPFISIGLNYNINEKMFLRIEPTYRYGIIKMLDYPMFATYLWNAGLNISYYYKLK